MVTISGRIEFGSEWPRPGEVTVYVWIEDTTYVDAPAVRVAEQNLPFVFDNSEPTGIPFTLDWDDEQLRSPGHSYSLAAFVDVDHDGRPGRGDYICQQAIPVPPPGRVTRLHVQKI
jgi:uncharacterized lipoprotein YbaY